jgi:FtsP/CotA-like multicopper oxidase with cupredoxin domain
VRKGKFVFHYHVLLHEDRGMTANVVVADRSLPNNACQ